MKNKEIQITTKRYPAYKDSGVKWIGDIPVGWEVKRLASIGSFSKGGGFSRTDLQEVGEKAILYGDIYTRYDIKIMNVNRFISAETSKGSVEINPGNLLFTGSGETAEDIGKCVVFASNENAYAGGDIILFKQSQHNSLFLSFTLNSEPVKQEKAKTAKGEIIVHTYASKLRNIYIPSPPMPEQKSIANFLDEKCEKIDRAVAQKVTLIGLLKERKQIVIQNAVTKGLNPNAKMKDSGVEWIGEIPVGWNVERNFQIFEERNEPGNSSLPILSVSIHTAVSSGELTGDENIRGKIRIADKSSYKLVKPNDIAFNMMRAWQGAIGCVPVQGMVSPAYIVAEPKGVTSSKFFEYQYRTKIFIQQMDRFSKGITDFRKRLYWNEFKQLKTIVPPLPEQTSIVRHIEAESAKIDKAIAVQKSLIEKLKEYKATLINSAVTGKIKVC